MFCKSDCKENDNTRLESGEIGNRVADKQTRLAREEYVKTSQIAKQNLHL